MPRKIARHTVGLGTLLTSLVLSSCSAAAQAGAYAEFDPARGTVEVTPSPASVDSSTGITLASARGQPLLRVGSRVRVRTRDDASDALLGWVERLDAETITLAGTDEEVLLPVKLTHVRRIEVKAVEGTKKRGMQTGVILGSLVGGTVGLLIGASAEPDCSPASWLCYEGLSTIVGAMTGAVAGMAVGGLIGWAVSPDGWVDVPLPGVEARPEGVGIAARAVFP